jgi:MFS family permease
MQQIALGWLVYRTTGSPFLLGLTAFLGQIPNFFIAPIGGVIADRYNRRRILLVTQTLAMFQALTLAFLVLTQQIEIWHIFLLSTLLGLITAVDTPVRQSFIVHMIENKEDLSNAIALNSSMVTGARLIGPSVAGIFIAVWGEGVCFLLNGLSYLAVLASLLAMNVLPAHPKNEHQMIHQLKEGFRYAFGFPPIRHILFLLALLSLTGVSQQTLMPVFARDIFRGGPLVLGFLIGASGLGALAGTVYLANRKNTLGLPRTIVISTLLFGIGLIVFSLSRTLWVSIPFVLIIGFGMIVQLATSNIILQTIVDEDKRGRVMSLYTVAFLGMAPFGSLLSGILASRIGAAETVFAAGFACLAGAFFFSRHLSEIRERNRPIYVAKGLLGEVTRGIQ